MSSSRKAVGLRYSGAEGAPKVTAKGSGEVAERIVELAREHGVPVESDPDLVQLLSVSEIGDEIPAEVYTAVARLITFLWEARDTVTGEGSPD